MSTSSNRVVVAVSACVVAATAIALVVLAVRAGTQRVIGGDLWEHAAVVRAFARDPWSPGHPLLAVDARHAFFSPWLLAIGVLARVSGLQPFDALMVAGVVSVLVLVGGHVVLVRRLSTSVSQSAVAAVCFITFSLLLWAQGGWRWSGFIHLDALLYTSAYPSTFAFGLSLWIVTAIASMTEETTTSSTTRLTIRAAALVVGIATVWVTHPTTAVSLSVFALATVVGRLPADRRAALVSLARLAACGILGLALAQVWPYFSLWSLLRDGGSAEFSATSSVLYKGPFGRMWPALVVGVPLFIVRAVRLRGRDPAVLATIGCFVVYGAAFVLDKEGLGRVIAWAVLGLHLTAALEIGAACARWRWPSVPVLVAATTAMIVVPLVLHRGLIADTVGRDRPMWPIPAALVGIVGDDDVVLSDLGTSLSVPSHAGKVVASSHPLYWVPDHAARRADIERFFKKRTTKAERLQIIERWNVRWLFIDRNRIKDKSVVNACAELGTVRKQGGQLLIDVAPNARR